MRVGPRRSIALALTVSLITLPAPSLFAAGEEETKAIATDLFDKGVKKMREGRCDEIPIASVVVCRSAREDFRRAYDLYPAALGALRNLAYIEKGLGLVASASRSFRELARRAPLDPKPERHQWADFARQEADVLEPRSPPLVVQMPSDRPPGTTALLDDKPLEEGAWGTVIDMDPGSHEVRAEAPGRLKFVVRVNLVDKQTKTVSVILDSEKSANVTTGPAPSRALPLIVGAVGVAGVAVGLSLGFAAMKKRDSACGSSKLCEPQGLSDGRALANASTAVTVVSSAVLAGGVIWFLLTPTGSSGAEERRAFLSPYASKDGAGFSAFARF
ncbi:MAG: hypothetical protein NVSMB1_01450 [Polyangiales bacterium]